MDLEPEQKYCNDAEGQTEHLGIGGHPIRAEGSTEVVFDDSNEDVTSVEDWASFFHDDEQDVQREDLGFRLFLLRELAHGAEHEVRVLLQRECEVGSEGLVSLY